MSQGPTSLPPRGGCRILCGVMIAMALAAAPARAAMVQVAVTGVPQARGHVRVELCTRTTFLTTACPYQGQAPAAPGLTLVTIGEVPPGEYAAQVFHDETDEGIVHQNLLGIPRERVGFSNDAPLRITGPQFRDAAFVVGAEVKHISVRLRHLFGLGD